MINLGTPLEEDMIAEQDKLWIVLPDKIDQIVEKDQQDYLYDIFTPLEDCICTSVYGFIMDIFNELETT